jgi:hypothetical protein
VNEILWLIIIRLAHLDWRYPINEYLFKLLGVLPAPHKYMPFLKKYRKLLLRREGQANETRQ